MRKIVIIFVPKKVRFLKGRKKVQGQKWTLREVRKNHLFRRGTVQSNFSTTSTFIERIFCASIYVQSQVHYRYNFGVNLLPGFSFSSDDCFQRSVCECTIQNISCCIISDVNREKEFFYLRRYFMLPQEAAKNKKDAQMLLLTLLGFTPQRYIAQVRLVSQSFFFISAFCSCTTTRPVCNSSVVLLGESEQLREIGWKVSLVCTFSDSRRSLSFSFSFSFSPRFQPLSAASLADCISDCLTLSLSFLWLLFPSLFRSFSLQLTSIMRSIRQLIWRLRRLESTLSVCLLCPFSFSFSFSFSGNSPCNCPTLSNSVNYHSRVYSYLTLTMTTTTTTTKSIGLPV